MGVYAGDSYKPATEQEFNRNMKALKVIAAAFVLFCVVVWLKG